MSNCKGKKDKENKKLEFSYIVNDNTSEVTFTAYKTTEKTPVKGVFTKISVVNAKKAPSPIDALQGLKFEIPVSSLVTKDESRDEKIKEFFFGVLKNSDIISGVFNFDDQQKCMLDITLNGITTSLPLNYKIIGETINFNGVMYLEAWNALQGINSINKACEALHTGADGVSKTWSEVAIEATTHLKIATIQ